MTDAYPGFQDLRTHASQGLDYEIVFRPGNSHFAVMAPHGGAIEPGTTAIAEGIAGRQHTYYTFKGIKSTGNAALHLTSHRFDEPHGLKIASQAATVVTIHGCQGAQARVFVGGRHRRLRQQMTKYLTRADFQAEISSLPGLRGLDPNNLCNRGHLGMGVQLELTRGLREKMFAGLDRYARCVPNGLFDRFIIAVREALAEHN